MKGSHSVAKVGAELRKTGGMMSSRWGIEGKRETYAYEYLMIKKIFDKLFKVN